MHAHGKARPSLTLSSLLLAWLLAATALGATGAVQHLAPPGPQILVVGLTALLLVATTRVASLRAWLAAIDARWLVGLHATRFVGAYFLALHARSELPWAFAVPGGIGDIVTATGAVAVVASGAPDTPTRRRLWFAWNAFGLADITGVVATAARCGIHDPASMAPLLRLPLSLLPTFLVPLIVASHVVLFRRLALPRHRGSSGQRPA